MDKYTVDLDKVLNDFEYTELTDHHVDANKLIKVEKVEQKNIPSSSNVKHSINNVFHSLNEYLNTEISPSCDINILNNRILNKNEASNNIYTKRVEDRVEKRNTETETNCDFLDEDDKPGESVINIKEEYEGKLQEIGGISHVLDITEEHQVSHGSDKNLTSTVRNIEIDDDTKEYRNQKYEIQEIEYSCEQVCDNESKSNVNNQCDSTDHDNKNVISEIIPNSQLTETSQHTPAETTEHVTITPATEYQNHNFKISKEETKEIIEGDNNSTKDEVTGNQTVVVNNGKPLNDEFCDAEKTEYNSTDSKEEIEDILVSNDEKRDIILNRDLRIVEENLKLDESDERKIKFVLNTGDSIEEDRWEDASDENKDSISENIVEEQSNGATDEMVQTINEKLAEEKSKIPDESSEMPNEGGFEAIGQGNFEDYKEKSEKTIEDKTEIINSESTNSAEDTASTNSSELPEVSENEANSLEEKTDKEKVCCFDDTLVNMDDTELNKYLEELEQEYESQYKNYEEESGSAAESKPNEIVSSEEERQSEENSIEIRQSSFNALSSMEEEKTSITSVKIIDAVTKDSDPDSYEETEEILEVTLEKVPVNEQAEDSSDKSERTHSSRPSSLDLGSNPSELKKSIDLIGEPGSTPYNNVYIVQELPKREQESSRAVDLDSENSSCTSPTFSNASTETVSSSTESSDIPLDETNAVVTGKHSTTAETHLQPPQYSEQASGSVQEGGRGDFDGERSNSSCDVLNNARDVAGAQAAETGARVEREGEANTAGDVEMSSRTSAANWIGKQAPVWVPDSEAMNCMLCDMKFTVIKRRHHCRACGRVVCSKCSSYKHRLEYLDAEARVCVKCYDILNRDTSSSSLSDMSVETSNPSRRNQPNPNNPLEYCSTVPPLQQIQGTTSPPAVLVPVGVLKRKGSNKMRTNKSVMFCDGIRPGSDLTNLDNDFNYGDGKNNKKSDKQGTNAKTSNKSYPPIDPETKSFIPNSDNNLPPTVSVHKTDITYSECANNPNVIEMLKNEPLTFAIQKNLYVHVKIINMSCCINKMAWCFSTEGLINVGQDEVVIILEYIEDETVVPKDIFSHINIIYTDAVKGNSVKEMGLSLHNTSNFLDSKNHAGFVFIKPTFQCLQNVIIPKETYLIGILIHRWETPWAKLFPLRLILRLGAEYRYYPSPIISTRHRDSVFVEVGHTIINLLADFRNYSYTLPQIRGLTIHMEGKNTTVTIPSNRYDQVMKNMNNSSDHILAFAGNFSQQADSHLVCIQDTHSNDNSYSTHSINIHNKERKVTGVSFIVFNGALKSSSGLSAKSSIVEDGLMIQVLPEHMAQIRDSLRNMKNHVIQCGCLNVATDETINIIWGEPDISFNIGVVSPIDGQSMSGVPSIRVHNGKDFVANSGNRLIRWTEVFILQNAEETSRNQDPVDISKVSESIAKATCQALVKYLDLLASNNFYKIGIRTTLHVENVSYAAGGNSVKLPPIYMKSLDNELIPVLHRITSNNLGENIIVLELIFRVLNV